jgi:PKD repeat protein
LPGPKARWAEETTAARYGCAGIKLAVPAAIAIAALAWTTRADATPRVHATPPALTCDGSWTDDRSPSNSRAISYPNYSPAEILINPGQTVDWEGSGPNANFSNDPLVDASGQLWGTFSINEPNWPFTYTRSGAWEYYNANNQMDAGIVCVTGPLVATFMPSPASPQPNQIVTFDASGSHENMATLQDYKWDFGSGSFTVDTGSTQMATHTFSKAGIYKVRLQVTDDSGQTQTASTQITVGTVITQPPNLKSTTVRETSAGKVPLDVQNPNEIAAKGVVTLTRTTGSKTAQIGSASFAVRAHGAKTVSVPLSSSAKTFLTKHPTLAAKAKITLSGNGTSKSKSFSVTIKRS